MIPLSDQTWQSQSWQELLTSSRISVKELLKHLDLPFDPVVWQAHPEFSVFVPRPFLARMERANSQDPLLLQVIPQSRELEVAQGYIADPLQEAKVTPLNGLLHKYKGRVLVIATGACAIHCRYCFRRHFPYADHQPDKRRWESILDHIRSDESISEVILSGGDPLVLNDRMLAWISEQLATIAHIKRLRIHTRVPVVIPQRISTALLTWMKASPLKIVMVIHCNHPNELDDNLALYLQKLRKIGVTILNQSVLLAGINDSADVLIKLSEKLFSMSVQPYYLHLLDKVSGAQHFEVSMTDARNLYQQVSAALPGYLVPKLVADQPEAEAKTLILP